MNDLLPVLVARVPVDDALAVIEAALRHGVAIVDLEELPSCDGPHVLEVFTPAWTEPLLLIAEPAGRAVRARCPLRLHPCAPEHQEILIALLAEAGIEARPSAREPAPASTQDNLVGRILGGHKYLVKKLLGTGAMGAVYEGVHLTLEKTIAIKVLHASHRTNDTFLAAFHREALAASRLDHPNVVQVLDFGDEPDGLLYLTMEVLAGTDLRKVLTDQPVQPLDRIVDILTQMCAALSASHDQNVVHRDIKPENIILVPKRDDDGKLRDVVKICDYGIAEIVGKRVTKADGHPQVAGTPDYMSPEQVRGGDVDARADLYACGVIIFEMATGKVPYHDRETPLDIALAHVQDEPPHPASINPDIDKRLVGVVQKAMAKDPAQRYQSARELRAALREVADAARREALLASFHDIGDAPVTATFERNDAIDIGDLFTVEPIAPSRQGRVKEQIWVLSEQMATSLIQDPATVLATVEALEEHADYARELSTLERAMAALAARGAAPALYAVVAHLAARTQGAAPGERTREALAARALRSIEKPELLLRVAEEALDGPPASREPARKVLAMLGTAGALALGAARERAEMPGPVSATRPRFVAAMRELDSMAALAALSSFLQQADPRDVPLLEDLLRAVPEVPAAQVTPPIAAACEKLGALLSTTHLRHASAQVRRAAAQALSAVWGARANAWLGPLLEDPDDGLRIAAIGALRRHGGVDLEVVKRVGRILNGQAPSGLELRIAAAGALVDTSGPARSQAAALLTQILRPPNHGFLQKLVTVELSEDAQVVATMAQVLLAISDAQGAQVVAAKAAKSSGETKRLLQQLLGGGRLRT